MKTTIDWHNDFLARTPIPGVELQHNDHVRVTGGPHSPDSGSVVSIESLGKDPVYLVELESGTDQLVQQSCLEFVSHG